MARGACIDIGSNTTRLVIADWDEGRLRLVAQESVFTHIGRARQADGSVEPTKLAEVALIVCGQLRRAHELDAHRVRAVATAAVRAASNGEVLIRSVRDLSGLEVEILSGEDEARLAFLGAAYALEVLGRSPEGELGVLDVGGGSSELVIGAVPDQVHWSASLPLGSAELTRGWLPSDPPAPGELAAARSHAAAVFDALDVPQPQTAVAVGGSATSLHMLAGPRLEEPGLSRCLEDLTSQPAPVLAEHYGLHPERVRLLPAGLLILQAASARLGLALTVGGGGLREGVLLEQLRS